VQDVTDSEKKSYDCTSCTHDNAQQHCTQSRHQRETKQTHFAPVTATGNLKVTQLL